VRRSEKKNWAARVEALVQRHGSAEALAVALGVSYLTVQRWRQGSHQPSRLAQRLLEGMER
jgi:DNA-binding transcriptional regulator YiaG